MFAKSLGPHSSGFKFHVQGKNWLLCLISMTFALNKDTPNHPGGVTAKSGFAVMELANLEVLLNLLRGAAVLMGGVAWLAHSPIVLRNSETKSRSHPFLALILIVAGLAP
jgi:hypothetical protein